MDDPNEIFSFFCSIYMTDDDNEKFVYQFSLFYYIIITNFFTAIVWQRLLMPIFFVV